MLTLLLVLAGASVIAMVAAAIYHTPNTPSPVSRRKRSRGTGSDVGWIPVMDGGDSDCSSADAGGGCDGGGGGE